MLFYSYKIDASKKTYSLKLLLKIYVLPIETSMCGFIISLLLETLGLLLKTVLVNLVINKEYLLPETLTIIHARSFPAVLHIVQYTTCIYRFAWLEKNP